MVEVNLVTESLKFMVLGMGVVFVFLYIMIKLLDLQAFIIQKYFPQKNNTNQKDLKKPNQNNKAKTVAAITAAIEHHNKVKG